VQDYFFTSVSILGIAYGWNKRTRGEELNMENNCVVALIFALRFATRKVNPELERISYKFLSSVVSTLRFGKSISSSWLTSNFALTVRGQIWHQISSSS